MHRELQAALENRKAIAFFPIQGKRAESTEGNTWIFTAGYKCQFHDASSTKKGAKLEAGTTELLAMHAQIVPKTVVQGLSDQNQNYADQEATETTCALHKSILNKIHIAAVEVDASFFQIK